MNLFPIIYYGSCNSRFGLCNIAIYAHQICYLGFLEKEQLERQLRQLLFPNSQLLYRPNMAKTLLDKIFNKNDVQNPLSLFLKGTPFQIKVWKALLNIPEGKLVAYQDIAFAIGQKKSARAVGNAIAANRIAYLIPCHRVIQASGKIGKYHWGKKRKSAMIAWEQQR